MQFLSVATHCCVTFSDKNALILSKEVLYVAKVSKNIKKLRTDNGLTQDALAEKINVTRQTVSSWENGVSHS